MSGVGFLPCRQLQADRQTQLHGMTNQLIWNCPRLELCFFHADKQIDRQAYADRQTQTLNGRSTDLKLPMSGVGFLPHTQANNRITNQLIWNCPCLGLGFFHTGWQANTNTNTQNDKSTDLKLLTSGVRFLPVLHGKSSNTGTVLSTQMDRQVVADREWPVQLPATAHIGGWVSSRWSRGFSTQTQRSQTAKPHCTCKIKSLFLWNCHGHS